MDKYNRKISLYRDVRAIFAELREMPILLAAASRSVKLARGVLCFKVFFYTSFHITSTIACLLASK